MNAAHARKIAWPLLLVVAVACSPGRPATDEQSRGQAEAAAASPADAAAPVNETAGIDPGDIADAVPENMRLLARLDADLIGSAPPAIVLIAADEDHYELRVLARGRAPDGAEVTTGILDSLTLDSSPHGRPTVSVAKRVLVVDHTTGGGSSTRAIYRYRFDADTDRMRLIGLDVERHVRTVSHDTLSWNLLTGARVLRTGRSDEGGVSDQAAFRYGPEHTTKLPVSPVYMAQTPDPDEVLDAALGSSGRGQCGEDDIACQETMYQLEETLFLYEGAVENAIGAAAQSCWSNDVAAFRRTLDDCSNPSCRQARLRERLASLSDLQPAGRRAEIPLPAQAPLLVAVLGPESGNEADNPATPFEVKGDLVHASAHRDHMGLAVRDGRGEHVIVFDMDIGNQPGHDQVMGLVGTSPTARVLVRGYRRMAPDGTANFDTARCRQVYQLEHDQNTDGGK